MLIKHKIQLTRISLYSGMMYLNSVILVMIRHDTTIFFLHFLCHIIIIYCTIIEEASRYSLVFVSQKIVEQLWRYGCFKKLLSSLPRPRWNVVLIYIPLTWLYTVKLTIGDGNCFVLSLTLLIGNEQNAQVHEVVLSQA